MKVTSFYTCQDDVTLDHSSSYCKLLNCNVLSYTCFVWSVSHLCDLSTIPCIGAGEASRESLEASGGVSTHSSEQ